MADLLGAYINGAHDVVYGEDSDAYLDAESVLIEGASGGGAVVVYYNMRAWNTNLTEYVYWQSTGTPDFTGASSGYPPGDLTFIVVQNAPRV